MKPLSDYNSIPEFTPIDTRKLPAGAYEITIKRAEEKNMNGEDYLCILFDISDGEYKDYFINKFMSDQKNFSESAKFKGVYRLPYPNGNEYDENRRKHMKTTLEHIKKSNNLNADFSKKWDGTVLKDCKAGMIFRDCEYDYKGYHGMSAQPYGIITLDELKTGNYTVPEPKYLKGSAPAPAPAPQEYTQNVSNFVDDLPF